MGTDKRDDWLARVYGARDDEELRRSYDAWAQDYDGDLIALGYRNPSLACGLTGRFVPSGPAELLDAGCGTGLLGELLGAIGYSRIAGVDLSDGMLGVARARGAYHELHRMVLGEPLAFDDGRFVASIALGVLTVGHAPPRALDELVRVTRTGGHVIFTLTTPALEQAGFAAKLEALDAAGRWRRVDVTAPYRVMPASATEGDLESRMYVYRVR